MRGGRPELRLLSRAQADHSRPLADPVTGRPLATADLIKLKFFKTPSGTYADPVTFKPFTPHTHIVFIASSGNVFAYDSIERLCIKTKSWRDLIDDSVFKREDIVTIQVR